MRNFKYYIVGISVLLLGIVAFIFYNKRKNNQALEALKNKLKGKLNNIPLDLLGKVEIKDLVPTLKSNEGDNNTTVTLVLNGESITITYGTPTMVNGYTLLISKDNNLIIRKSEKTVKSINLTKI